MRGEATGLFREVVHQRIYTEHSQLTVLETTKTAVQFKYTEDHNKKPRIFTFEFRYYNPYVEGVANGVYTFKTVDRESLPFPHRLVAITVQAPNILTLQYISNREKKTHFVEIKLPKKPAEPIQFTVDFGGLEFSSEAVATWKESGYPTEGVFYTDSNGLGILKRTP